MDTAAVRAAVAHEAPSPRSIWPNGLGFDWRGWSYMLRHHDVWFAVHTDKHGRTWQGLGETPADAKSVATPPPED
jgi:hypothetical protein